MRTAVQVVGEAAERRIISENVGTRGTRAQYAKKTPQLFSYGVFGISEGFYFYIISFDRIPVVYRCFVPDFEKSGTVGNAE